MVCLSTLPVTILSLWNVLWNVIVEFVLILKAAWEIKYFCIKKRKLPELTCEEEMCPVCEESPGRSCQNKSPQYFVVTCLDCVLFYYFRDQCTVCYGNFNHASLWVKDVCVGGGALFHFAISHEWRRSPLTSDKETGRLVANNTNRSSRQVHSIRWSDEHYWLQEQLTFLEFRLSHSVKGKPFL